VGHDRSIGNAIGGDLDIFYTMLAVLAKMRSTTRMRRGRQAGRLAALLAGLVLVAVGLMVSLVLESGTRDTNDSDVDNVYCQAPAHLPEVVDAAKALGLVDPNSGHGIVHETNGSPGLTIAVWRQRAPTKFQRACTAVVGAAQLPTGNASATASSNGLMSTINVLIPVLLGALLTLLVAEWRASRDRDRAEADGIRAAAAEFTRAVDGYLQGRTATVGGLPDAGPSVDRLRDLVRLLRQSLLRRESWTDLGADVAELAKADIRQKWFDGWPTGTADSRTVMADRVRGKVADWVNAADGVALAIERRAVPVTRFSAVTLDQQFADNGQEVS
jgi:hypothetical protein